METVSHAIDRLDRAGYTEQFRAERGQIVALRSGRRFAPEELHADQQFRFEGVSDPDDEAIVYALSNADATVRGTFCVIYGPGVPPEEVEVLQRLGTG